jgi:type IV secretory pathway TraG/TraD family ATPase VirD4
MLLLDWRLRNNVSNSKRVFPKWLVYYGIIVIISILLFVNGADQFILTIYEFALIILNFAFFFYFLLRYFARKKEIQK